MKNLINKLIPLFGKLQGKKPIVIALIVLAIGGSYFAVQKGWISEEAINIDNIVHVITNAFEDSAAVAPVDSVALPVDSLETVVVDSLEAN